MIYFFFSFMEHCGSNPFFVIYCLPLIVVIPFHLTSVSTYTRLYRFVRYRLLFFLRNKPKLRRKSCSYGAWLRRNHRIPRRQQNRTRTTTTSTYNTSYSCQHPSSKYSRDYMFNIYFPEYFSGIFSHFHFPTPKPKRSPRKMSYSYKPTTYTPSPNPKNPRFYYYNKKKSNRKKHYSFDTNNNKQYSVKFNRQRVHRPAPSTEPSQPRAWYKYNVNRLCDEYDYFIFQSILHWSSCNSPLTEYPLFYSTTSIENFVDSFDVLKHYHSLQQMRTATIPPHYKSLPTVSRLYQRILLEARDLQSSLNQYTDKTSLPPTIFTSCRTGELPIVIDTGASMSITPVLSDFAVHPTPSTTKSLGSLTTAKTTISGEGMATWLIKDFNGITRSLSTTAYYVPDATIRLFSPQVYIRENPTNSSLLLDSEGIAMTLTCGTILRFPLQKGSNLPIILTQKL